ncbi:SRPBCC family protein [Amycolatopsis jiangsuensis]|uniref:Carbon monoxide dehydrogenase subunit G n=1 Tax=Amycolatopsis jiangsuensis TaxID=1181879 RepID=A0A840INJ2_9PSEU|nr:SRPBCC family protein [Amycolatopsis jiangsuensis]MBB4683991.1 carbon monoxide dehydrogenase subunit G [Amycolatopsis jiangsuensis]
MIKIDEEIPVPAPPERVWEVVSDPGQVVSCISGAELGESHEDGSFDGTLVVKFGAVRVRFGARMSLDLEEPEREGRLSARGRDGQGATRFSAHATFRVTEDAGGSWVRVTGEVSLAGKLASLIEAGAGAVVSRMTKEFSDELVRRCAGSTAVVPAPRRTVWSRLRAWWQRIVHKRQDNPSEVRSGKAQ